MLAAADQHGRKQHIRLVKRLGLKVRRDGKLADIEFRVTHDLFEEIVCDLDVSEIEVDQIGMQLAALERLGVGIVAEHRSQSDLVLDHWERSLLCRNRGGRVSGAGEAAPDRLNEAWPVRR